MENATNNQNSGQGFAIASLVIGILALLVSIIPCVGASAILMGIVAVVFGAIALVKASTNQGPKGLSIAGISLGGLAIIIAILWLVFIVGSKNVLKNKFENFYNWTEEFENINIDLDDDDFEQIESLEELENALDELEGVIDEADTIANEATETAREAVKEAKKEVEAAKVK